MTLCAVAAAAHAQSAATAAGSATAAAPAFRCGGVGQDEQASMKAEAGRHDLLVTFATSSGAYLSDVDVEIRSGGKVVMEGRCSGPLMLVDLPGAGSYEVRASANGRQQRKTVQHGGKPSRMTFSWAG